MTLPQWVGRLLKPHKSSKQEIAGILEIARKYLSGAREKALEPMIRFVLAYNAALEVSTAVLRAEGFRTEGQGHHRATFEALKELFGPGGKTLGSYFNKCRKLRNTATYSKPITITDAQASELIREVERFRSLLMSWLKRRHPHLL